MRRLVITLSLAIAALTSGCNMDVLDPWTTDGEVGARDIVTALGETPQTASLDSSAQETRYVAAAARDPQRDRLSRELAARGCVVGGDAAYRAWNAQYDVVLVEASADCASTEATRLLTVLDASTPEVIGSVFLTPTSDGNAMMTFVTSADVMTSVQVAR